MKNLDGIFSGGFVMQIPPNTDSLVSSAGGADNASGITNVNQCRDSLKRPCVALEQEGRLCHALLAAILLSGDRNLAAKVVMQTIADKVGDSSVVNPSACGRCKFVVSDADIQTIAQLASTLKSPQDSRVY